MAQASDDPFAAYKKPPTDGGDDPFAAYKTPPTVSAPDFTKGNGGEGSYQMVGPDGKFVAIPYSNVMTASGAGYRIKPDERERYGRDRIAELRRKKTPEAELQSLALPEAVPEKPGPWSRMERRVQSATEPTDVFPGMPMSLTDPAAGEFGLNTIKRVGRVLFGIPDLAPQAYSALKDVFSVDPQKATDGMNRLLQMNPGQQIYDRVMELRNDFHRDPKLAAANVAGDVIGIWLAGKAAEVPGKVGTYVTETYPMRLINNLIKPSTADMKFGRNPARAILEEGLTGNSLHELGDKTFARIHEVGKEIDRQAKLPQNASKVVDVSSSLKPIDDAMLEAQRAGDAGLFGKLNDLKSELTYNWKPFRDAKGNLSLRPVGRRSLRMSPEAALKFKRMVGDKVTWTGNDPFENVVNEAAGKVYGNIKDQVNQAVPGLKALNERYSNLLGAGKAIQRRVPVEERNAQWSLSDIVLGSTGHLPIAIARKALSLPAAKTRIARELYGMGSHGPRQPMIPRGTPPAAPAPRLLAMKTAARVAAAASAAQQRAKTLHELQAEAAQRRPAGAMASSP